MAHLRAKSEGEAPLLAHLCDVCTQAASFIRAYNPEWHLPSGCDGRRILAYASLLHDFGKVHPGFQAALGKSGPRFRNRHEVLSSAFLGWLDAPEAERRWIAAAVLTHHKSWIELAERFATDAESQETDLGRLCTGIPESDARLLHEVLLGAESIIVAAGWVGLGSYAVKSYAPLDYRFWILQAVEEMKSLARDVSPQRQRRPGAAEERNWSPVQGAIHTRGWLLSADHLASFRSYDIQTAFGNVADVDRAYPSFSWNAHQKAAGNHDGSGLLIAPTGTGKTEAGLRWAARQSETGATGRICVLLPYQASLNAMQKRLVERLFREAAGAPERWNENVSLLHGRAARHLYESFLRLDYAPSKAEREARDQNNLARLFAAPISVSTVFSVIRLLFATRGAERLMVSFSSARIVVDEIHAYEPQITALTLAALRFLIDRLGTRVLFMSATVPPHLETALKTCLQIENIAPEESGGGRARHRMSLLPFDCADERAIDAIRNASRTGSVLVVVNQVRRAMELWNGLRRDLNCDLLHSRFNFADRARIESRIAPTKGSVLVGTQAVEVSLDLDFDVCFSEMAPVESLVQRFGRCNRKGLREAAPVYVFSAFPEGKRAHLPYDEEHLRRVGELLRDYCGADGREFGSGDVKELLARSYSEAMARALEREIGEKTADFRRLFVDNWKPFGLDSGAEKEVLEERWTELFDGAEVLPESLIPAAQAEGSKLGIARFLVPISGEQVRRFGKEIRWDGELLCRVIDRPYGSAGLDLHSR